MVSIQAFIELSLTLIKNVAVIIVLAYVFTRTQVYNAVLHNKLSLRHRFSLVLIFGIFSIYGTLSGIKILGGVANIRDLGPAIAGLIAGPWVGFGAGLLGAAHRYSLGGLTASSCALSTIIAGLLGGIIYKLNRDRFVRVIPATLFMMAMETLHMGLALLISHPYYLVLALVKQVSLPMIATNGLGMAVFAFMVWNLIRERQTESIKELIEGELKVAREIQLSMVPKLFPPYPERDEFDIHAFLEPAKEVGGDFYDFYLLDHDTLYFTIGDVSGKGVPASLFMAVTKTLIKAGATPGLKPDAVLTAVNNELCRDNHSSMFVTVFLGCLDIPSGRIFYSSGGHNLPYLVRRDGRLKPLEQTPGMALGIMEHVTYGCAELTLQPDETLVLYTDGVVEATDPQGGLYGEAQLESVLKEHSGAALKIITRKVWHDVNRFAATAPQTDDITLLALRYHKSRPQLQLSLKNDPAEIPQLAARVTAFGLHHTIPNAILETVNLCLDELITNIIAYGYQIREEHQILLDIAIAKDRLEVEIRDDARAFNPLDSPDPDLEAGIETRPIGGLGIHLVRQLAEDLSYRREGSENVLTFRKTFKV